MDGSDAGRADAAADGETTQVSIAPQATLKVRGSATLNGMSDHRKQDRRLPIW
jgi:hypothetical protein